MKIKRVGIAMLMASCSFVAQAQGRQTGELRDALIPIEVLEPDPAFTGELFQKGIRWDARVLASQPARIARGIVLRETKGTLPHGTILALALLDEIVADDAGKAVLDVPLERTAWCEDPSGGPVTVRCFQDLDGDSKLDVQLTGYLPRTDALALNRVGDAKPITPVPYRPATPEELTQLHLEYLACPTDDATLKYALRVRRLKIRAFGGSDADACTQIATTTTLANGDQGYSVGRMKIAVNDDRRTTRVAEAIPPGTILGHVRPDQPLTDALHAQRYSELQASRKASLPFLYFVTGASVPTDPIASGDLIMNAEVAHGISGRLKADVMKPGWLNSKTPYFPAGTPMYGVEMSSKQAQPTLDASVVWCVPIHERSSAAECMVKAGASYHLAQAYHQFDVRDLSISMSGNFVTSPVVEIGPVDFGSPLLLQIRFDGWKKREAIVSYRVGLQGDNDDGFWKLKLKRDANGAAWLLIGDKALAIQPAPNDSDAAIITMAHPPQANDAAEVIDAYDLMREARRQR